MKRDAHIIDKNDIKVKKFGVIGVFTKILAVLVITG